MLADAVAALAQTKRCRGCSPEVVTCAAGAVLSRLVAQTVATGRHAGLCGARLLDTLSSSPLETAAVSAGQMGLQQGIPCARAVGAGVRQRERHAPGRCAVSQLPASSPASRACKVWAEMVTPSTIYKGLGEQPQDPVS